MTQPGSLADSVAAEVRAELARRSKKAAWLARELGVSDMYLSRRLRGEVPFDLADLEKVTAALGVPLVGLLPAAGTGPTHPTPTHPGNPRPATPPPPPPPPPTKGAHTEGEAA